MNQPSTSRLDWWKSRLGHLRMWVKAVAPFAAGVLAALAALFLYNTIVPAPKPLSVKDVKNTIAQVMASATPPPAFSEQVYRVIQPSLVLIQTKAEHEHANTDFGLGSGVVIDNQGDILTSLHVVQDTTAIKVIFADGSESDAKMVASQPEHDIAVLQALTPPKQLFPAVLGNPNSMRVGDEAYVVGNPFGLYSSMSAGVISGFDRVFKLPESGIEMNGMIQIDAAVNPGNSGGPLVNRSGNVIGIITGLTNPTDQNFFIGIGFAVPINVAVGAIGQPPPY
jgi:S1-C subfamily serine protease